MPSEPRQPTPQTRREPRQTGPPNTHTRPFRRREGRKRATLKELAEVPPAKTPPLFSSVVHTSETKSQPDPHIPYVAWGPISEWSIQPVNPTESSFRHSFWVVRRILLWNALQRLHIGDRALERFANCGSTMMMEVHPESGDVRMKCFKCRHRLCAACAAERGGRMKERLAELVIDNPGCRFLTLTLKHSDTPLTEQIDRLYKCFNDFRRRQVWKDNVRGGCGVLEIKVGKDALWHPHLHCIVTGRWWEHREISQTWLSITGDSSIVHIKPISNPDDAAHYVGKYVTKPADSTIWRDEGRLDEFIAAIKGRRVCMTFGDWRGEKLDVLPEKTEGWITCGDPETLIRRARDGDEEAKRYCAIAARKWPLFAEYFLETGPDP